MKKTLIGIIISVLVLILLGCTGGKMEEKKIKYSSIDEVPDQVWSDFSKKSIYFAHQSIGFNVIDGIKDIMKEKPAIKLNFVESASLSDLSKGNFLHSRVGANSEPSIKIGDYADNIENGLGNKVDIAFLKFCYYDVVDKTDPQQVFDIYSKKMDELVKKYPKTQFVHLTVPLTVSKSNWKTWLKKMTGKGDLWEYKDNIKRNELNTLINERYSDSVFDFAKIESTYADNQLSGFTYKDTSYYSLYPEYTDDGGHLNEVGRKILAEQLLLYLVNL